MKDHDNAGCAINGAAAVFPQTNKDVCCDTKHASFGCDYTGIANGTFSHPGGSVADVVRRHTTMIDRHNMIDFR